MIPTKFLVARHRADRETTRDAVVLWALRALRETRIDSYAMMGLATAVSALVADRRRYDEAPAPPAASDLHAALAALSVVPSADFTPDPGDEAERRRLAVSLAAPLAAAVRAVAGRPWWYPARETGVEECIGCYENRKTGADAQHAVDCEYLDADAALDAFNAAVAALGFEAPPASSTESAP